MVQAHQITEMVHARTKTETGAAKREQIQWSEFFETKETCYFAGKESKEDPGEAYVTLEARILCYVLNSYKCGPQGGDDREDDGHNRVHERIACLHANSCTSELEQGGPRICTGRHIAGCTDNL